MSTSTRWMVLGFCTAALAAPAHAQGPPVPTAQIEAMGKMDFLLGRWQGSGWAEMVPGRRSTFTGTETVARRLGGTVVVIEGLHKAPAPGGGEERVVHEALAVVSFDPQGQEYAMQSWIALGHGARATVRFPSAEVLEWGLATPRGPVRYRITRTPEGKWHEVGETSPDGKDWRTFLEMTLARVD